MRRGSTDGIDSHPSHRIDSVVEIFIEEVNGIPLSYEATGHGEPLVLVHGSWAQAQTWSFVAPGLAESFQVVPYDRRVTEAAVRGFLHST